MIYAIPNLNFTKYESQSEQFVPFLYHQYFPHCITELFSKITSSSEHQSEIRDDNSYKHGPIQSLAEDKLERENFVKNLAHGLLNWGSQNETFIVALTGKWGEGKTSVINLVKQELESKDKLIFEFNPASFAETNKIQDTFFEELAKLFKVKTSGNYKKTAKKIKLYKNLIGGTIKTKNEIQTFSNILLGLGTLCAMYPSFSNSLNYIKINLLVEIAPYFAIGLISIPILGVLANPVLSYFNFLSETKSTSDIKNEIQNILQKEEKKLIIIIDDIDRLTKSEVRNLLLMIKINADFCNTNYLLSFDRAILENLLSKDPEVSSSNFLSKIVQHSIELPKSNKININNYAEKIIKLAIEQHVSSNDRLGFDEKRFRGIIEKGFLAPFETIRDVKRYCNLIRTIIPLHIHDGYLECDLIDVLCIEWIKYFEPQLHDEIYRLQGKIKLDDLYPYKNSNYAHIFQRIVKSLLPAGPNSSPSACISSSQSFDKYFILNINQNLPEYKKSKLLYAQDAESIIDIYNELTTEHPKLLVIDTFGDILKHIDEHEKFCGYLSFLIHLEFHETNKHIKSRLERVLYYYIEDKNFTIETLTCFNEDYHNIIVLAHALHTLTTTKQEDYERIEKSNAKKLLHKIENNFSNIDSISAYKTVATCIILYKNHTIQNFTNNISRNHCNLHVFLMTANGFFGNQEYNYPHDLQLKILRQLFNINTLEQTINNHLLDTPDMDATRRDFFTNYMQNITQLSNQNSSK